MVRLNGCECFMARRDASLLYVTVAAVPIPPAAEKTMQRSEGSGVTTIGAGRAVTPPLSQN